MSSTPLLDSTLASARRQLPSGWFLTVDGPLNGDPGSPADFVVLRPPGGGRFRLLALARAAAWPRDMPSIRAEMEKLAGRSQRPVDGGILVARWLSPRTRRDLRDAGINYADSTGSLYIQSRKPAVLLRLDGAERDPNPPPASLKSLRGPAAARAIRALIEHQPPFGIRELAGASGVPAPTISRVVPLLERDNLLNLSPARRIEDVDFAGLVRRWGDEYPPRGVVERNFIEPRGLDALLEKLRRIAEPHIVSGDLAVRGASLPSVVAPALALVHVRDPESAGAALDLVPVGRGGNVLLRSAWDPSMLQRRWPGVVPDRLADPVQLAVDLETSPGRSIADVDVVLEWMRQNPRLWRRPTR